MDHKTAPGAKRPRCGLDTAVRSEVEIPNSSMIDFGPDFVCLPRSIHTGHPHRHLVQDEGVSSQIPADLRGVGDSAMRPAKAPHYFQPHDFRPRQTAMPGPVLRLYS